MNMKIYYVANARMPNEKAHGIQLAKMCEAFVDAGANFELIVPNRGEKKSIRRFYGLDHDIPVKYLPIINTYNFGRFGFAFASLTFMFSYLFYLLFKNIKRENFIIYTIDMDQFSFLFIPFIGKKYFVEIHDAKEKDSHFKSCKRKNW